MRKQIIDLQPAVFEEGDLIRKYIGIQFKPINKKLDIDGNYFIAVRKADGFDYCISVDSFIEFIKNKINKKGE